MVFEFSGNINELSLSEMQEIDGARGGSILTGSAGVLVGELAWEAMFGNNLAGNMLLFDERYP